MKRGKHGFETAVHGIFLVLGLITVGCVLLITVYLVAAGIPAIREIGLTKFLFGKKWASTAAEPSFGILPFILTSVYGTAGAMLIGVPVGFLTAVYLAKAAPPRVRAVMQSAVSLLAGIPSVVYGLVGMLVLVPGIRRHLRHRRRREPAGGDDRAGDHDTAVDHQGIGDGAGGRAPRI